MTGTFKANIPYNNFLLLIYAAVLRIPSFVFAEPTLPRQEDAFLYKGLLQLLEPAGSSFPWIYPAISLLLLYFQAVWFNKIVNNQRLFTKPHYLTGMSFLLITAMFTDWYRLSAPMIVNTVFIWVWAKLVTLHNDQRPKSSIFNIGLLTSAATFVYAPSFAFVVLIMVGITIARPFRLREWLMGLIGFITPYYFFASWLYLTNRWNKVRFPSVVLHTPVFSESRWTYIGIAMLLAVMLLGIFFVQANMRRQVVQTRKSWHLLYLYFAVAVLVPFLSRVSGFEFWILAAVPLSLLITAAFFYPDKKLFPQIMHWCMAALCIAAFVALLNEKGIVLLH
ncbi:MAG: DUF6427 family protein [Ferruginibacter sp.]